MPRDGSNIYHRPSGTDGIPNYTIESAKYNSYVADVEQDLNLPRPIVAGGTGANNARDAMTSLQGDVAYQVVTNYDAYAFASGSFYSAAGATSAPTANAFIGQCYTSDPAVVPPAVPAGQNMFIEARDVTTGLKYLRQKTAGAWGAWAQQAGSNAVLDAAYVNVSGDVMTGGLTAPTLTISGSAAGVAELTLTDTSSGGHTMLQGWQVGTGNVNFYAFYDAGSGMQAYLNRTLASWNVNGNITAGNGGTTGTYFFGNSGTKSLSFDGTNFVLSGGVNVILSGQLLVNAANITSGQGGTTGTYYFGNSGTKYLSYDGSNFNISGGPLVTSGLILANSYIQSVQAANQGLFIFGSSGTKTLNCDGTNFNFVGGNLNAPGHASVAAAGGPSYTLDVTTTTYAVAVGANFLIVTNFSGLIISTSYATGLTDVFATGGGSVIRLGGSGGATAHTACGYAAPQAGYVLTNTSGVANTFGVAVIRTRLSG
jgi:hypothetical protein